MKLALIPQDKANHVIDGAVVYIVVRFVAEFFALTHSREIALAASALAGAAKEALDYALNRRALGAGLKPAHGVDFMDFVSTCAGGLACYVAGA